MIGSIFWLLLLTFIEDHTCMNEEVIFDSHKTPLVLLASGGWKYDSTANVYTVINGGAGDVIETQILIQYNILNLNVVYLNITYTTYTPTSQLLMKTSRYEQTAGSVAILSILQFNVPVFPSNYNRSFSTDKILIQNATYGITFSISCKNFSGQLHRILLFSNYCPPTTSGGANFPRTFTKPDSSITVHGSCNNITTPSTEGPPYLICTKNGLYERGAFFSSCICSNGSGYINGTCQGKSI